MVHKCRTRKGLGENIRRVLVGRDPDWCEGSLFDVTSDEVITQINVLSTNVVGSLLGEGNSSCVVGEQLEGKGNRELQAPEEGLEPNTVLDSGSESHILRFRRR